MSQTISIERVDHIGIRVRDLDRALNFYRALGFILFHRSENDDVAIIRNENSVELNLIFNANAGNPTANVLMGCSGEVPGLHAHGPPGRVHPGDHRRPEGERHRDNPRSRQLR